MSKVTMTAARINELQPMEIANNPDVMRQWINIYGTLWGESNAEAAYERESIHFNRILRDNDKLRACTPTSIYIAFIDLAVCGLSLEPGVRALAYLQPRGYKTGQKNEKGGDIYEQRCCLVISGYGELVQRTRVGQIRHADNPVIVYEGDEFSFSDRDGRKSVNYTLNLNHNPQHPIACFMRITRADGSIDYAVLLEEGWQRLAQYSAKSNKYFDQQKREYVERPNPLYNSGSNGSIDAGFLIAKCIKHAFKTYPKVRIGKGTSYEADQQPQDDDLYGFDQQADSRGGRLASVTAGRNPEESPDESASFSPAPDMSAGVTVDPQANDSDDGTW